MENFVIVSNNFSTVPSLTLHTLTIELWIQYILFYVILGVFSSCGNIFLSVVIISDKRLHSFFYILLCGHTLSRGVYSLQVFAIGIYRVFTQLESGLVTSRLVCHTVHFFIYFCQSFSSTSILLLAIDRWYSLHKPLAYRKHLFKNAIYVTAGLAVGIFIAKIVPSYFGDELLSKQIECITARSAVTRLWWDYHSYSNFFCVFVSLIIYIYLFTVSSVRKRNLVHEYHSEDHNQILIHQMALLHSIGLLIISNLIIVTPFNILQIMSNYFDESVSSRFIMYGSCFSSVDRLIDVFILLWKSSELRRSVFDFFTKT